MRSPAVIKFRRRQSLAPLHIAPGGPWLHLQLIQHQRTKLVIVYPRSPPYIGVKTGAVYERKEHEEGAHLVTVEKLGQSLCAVQHTHHCRRDSSKPGHGLGSLPDARLYNVGTQSDRRQYPGCRRL